MAAGPTGWRRGAVIRDISGWIAGLTLLTELANGAWRVIAPFGPPTQWEAWTAAAEANIPSLVAMGLALLLGLVWYALRLDRVGVAAVALAVFGVALAVAIGVAFATGAPHGAGWEQVLGTGVVLAAVVATGIGLRDLLAEYYRRGGGQRV